MMNEGQAHREFSVFGIDLRGALALLMLLTVIGFWYFSNKSFADTEYSGEIPPALNQQGKYLSSNGEIYEWKTLSFSGRGGGGQGSLAGFGIIVNNLDDSWIIAVNQVDLNFVYATNDKIDQNFVSYIGATRDINVADHNIISLRNIDANLFHSKSGYICDDQNCFVIQDLNKQDTNNASMLTMLSAGNIFQLKSDEIGGVDLTETITGNTLWHVDNDFFQPLNIKLSDILGTSSGSPLLVVNDNGYLDSFEGTGMIKTDVVGNEYTAGLAVPNIDYLAPNFDSNQQDINAITVSANSMYVNTWNGYSDTNFIKQNGDTILGDYLLAGNWNLLDSIDPITPYQLSFGNLGYAGLILLAQTGYYATTIEPTFYLNATGTPIEILTAATKYFMIRNNSGTPLFKIENDTGNLYTKNDVNIGQDVNIGRDLNAVRTIDANRIRMTAPGKNSAQFRYLTGLPAISGTSNIYVAPSQTEASDALSATYAGYFTNNGTAGGYGFNYNDNATMIMGAGSSSPIFRAMYSGQIPGGGDTNQYYTVMIGLADTNYTATTRGGRYMIIADKNELFPVAYNFGHGYQSNPTTFWQSSSSLKNEWGSLAHNWNSFDINSGKGPVRSVVDFNIGTKTSHREDGNTYETSPDGHTWNCGITNAGEHKCS